GGTDHPRSDRVATVARPADRTGVVRAASGGRASHRDPARPRTVISPREGLRPRGRGAAGGHPVPDRSAYRAGAQCRTHGSDHGPGPRHRSHRSRDRGPAVWPIPHRRRIPDELGSGPGHTGRRGSPPMTTPSWQPHEPQQPAAPADPHHPGTSPTPPHQQAATPASEQPAAPATGQQPAAASGAAGSGHVDDEARRALASVRGEVAKAVVGQDPAVTGLVISLLCGGHVLLEGVPGVAKTLLTRALGAALDLEMKRVQFTPDLMPGDVTGSLVYDARTAEFSFREGPVFTNVML